MEDVKDTLWKWMVQILALANLGWEIWGITFFARKLGEAPGSEPMPGEVTTALIVGMIAVALLFYLRLLGLRKWAGWLKVLTSGAHVYRSIALSELGLWHWSPLLALATAIILAHSLIFKGRLWRGGF